MEGQHSLRRKYTTIAFFRHGFDRNIRLPYKPSDSHARNTRPKKIANSRSVRKRLLVGPLKLASYANASPGWKWLEYNRLRVSNKAFREPWCDNVRRLVYSNRRSMTSLPALGFCVFHSICSLKMRNFYNFAYHFLDSDHREAPFWWLADASMSISINSLYVGHPQIDNGTDELASSYVYAEDMFILWRSTCA